MQKIVCEELHIIIANIIEHLQCLKHRSKGFHVYIISYNSQTNHMKWVLLLFLFFK